jgi:hypothetical protein
MHAAAYVSRPGGQNRENYCWGNAAALAFQCDERLRAKMGILVAVFSLLQKRARTYGMAKTSERGAKLGKQHSETREGKHSASWGALEEHASLMRHPSNIAANQIIVSKLIRVQRLLAVRHY